MVPKLSNEGSTLFPKINRKLFSHRVYRKRTTKTNLHVDLDDILDEIPLCNMFRFDVALNVNEIGANWIQRKIKEECGIGGQKSREIAEEVFNILAQDCEDGEVEKKLLGVNLGSGFVKFLLRNRFKIVWCTRLMRAVVEEQRNQIVDEMMGLGPEHLALLEELCLTRKGVKVAGSISKKRLRR